MEKEIEKKDSIIDGHHPPDEFLVMQSLTIGSMYGIFTYSWLIFIKGYRPCRRPQRQDLMTGGGYLHDSFNTL